jgi:hypothetical protein
MKSLPKLRDETANGKEGDDSISGSILLSGVTES